MKTGQKPFREVQERPARQDEKTRFDGELAKE
jgi:hypothetical protein